MDEIIDRPDLYNARTSPAISAAAAVHYRVLRNAECKRARYAVRLSSLQRYASTGITPRTHAITCNPIFGEDDKEFTKTWREARRRCEVQLTNMLIQKATSTIKTLDVTIGVAARDIARYCTNRATMK